MKVSTKGRYGLRALVDLAVHSCEGQVSLAEIAKRQKISLNYLEQVFAVMRRAGFVKSVKGFQGGYMLAMEPESITVDMVVTVLEGEFRIVDDSIFEVDEQDALRLAVKELVWDPINTKVGEYIHSTTLKDICQDYQTRQTDSMIMYYI